MSEYYTAAEIVKGDFLFVSYKHEDHDTVFGIVDILLSMGVRVWCDADLKAGDEWDERVKKIIEHSSCKGVIFFNSVNAFTSASIAQERAITASKRKLCKENGEPFLILPVNIGKPSTMRLLKKTFEMLEDDDSEIDRKLPPDNIVNILDLFNNKTLYIHADETNAQSCATSLYDSIKSSVPTAIDNSRVRFKNLQSNFTRKAGDLPCIAFGKYKGAQSNNLPSYHLDTDGPITYREETYLVEAGIAFTAVDIDWICIYCRGDETVLVSEKILESRNGGSDLIRWLNTSFLNTSFTEKERECIIGEISLVSSKDIEASDSKDFLVAADNERIPSKQWWINEYSMGVMQKIIREDGSIYNNGYNSRIKKCGVRPMIRVNMKDVIRIKEDTKK